METPEATQRTDKYVQARALEILEEARGRGYFIFKCRVESSDSSMPLMFTFGKGGDTIFERQLGWARFYRDAGGNPDAAVAEHLKEIVDREILAADGIEAWRKGSVKRA
jgi:hypothetical protein